MSNYRAHPILGICSAKSKETKVVVFTCTYSSGHLIPCQNELDSLEYLQV